MSTERVGVEFNTPRDTI